MGRLCETGLLERFLDDNCGGNRANSLCAYRNRLPNDASAFMWSPMNQTGGWNAFVTGSLANVLDRLQVRMAWLLPFSTLLLAAQHGPVELAKGLKQLGKRPRLANN